MTYIIRQATTADLGSIKALLQENKQKSSVVINDQAIYLLAYDEANLVGCIGSEINKNFALIRSTAVLSPWRNNGVAREMIETLLSLLKGRAVSTAYLFSRDSGAYWQKFGFENCSVEIVVRDLPDAPQVIGYVHDQSIWTDVAWRKPL